MLALLYLFLTGVSLLESGIGALGADVQARLFERVANPVAGLFVGVLATVLVQSSSVTTSTIVGLVAGGILSIDDAVPMIMGANIGTTVTNTLASVGAVRRAVEFRRAFAAATMHDFFNVIAVAVLLPLELVTGVISTAAGWLSEQLVGQGGTTYRSPVKAAVQLPTEAIGGLVERLGAAGVVLGVILIALGLAGIFVALALITRNMRALVAARVERAINRVLGKSGGLVAMGVGVVMTVAVQSSSITTSVLVPLAGAGVLRLENAFPVTLGANIGTTVTALVASLATDRPEALTIALVHLLFNVAGILIVYPVPAIRSVPLRLADGLAGLAIARPMLTAAYVGGTFVVVPLVGITVLG